MSFSHLCHRTKVLVTLPNVIICEVEICFLGHCNTGMSQQTAEGIYIHSVHQTALCKVIAQTVRRNGVFQSRSSEVFFEVSLEIPHLYTSAAILDRKKIITVNVSVFVLKPAPQDALCALREKHCSVLPPLRHLRSQDNLMPRKLYIGYQKAAALAQSHAGIEHQHYHGIIPMLRKI